MRYLSILALLMLYNAGIAQNYNPFVNAGIILPAPLKPLVANGTGTITFNFGNSGSSDIIYPPVSSGTEVKLTVTLSRGVPNAVVATDALGGTIKGKFAWTYDSGTKTFTGVQNSTIAGGETGTITVDYKVASNSGKATPQNGFLVNIIPGFTAISNVTGDDAVSSYTWTTFIISGTVFNDKNGQTNGLIDGTPTNVGQSLYISLYRPLSDEILQTLPISNVPGDIGNYLFDNIPTTGTDGLEIILHTDPSPVTTPIPASLPATYVNTAEGTTASGADGLIDGKIIFASPRPTKDTTGNNFGIDRRPETDNKIENFVFTPVENNNYSFVSESLTGSDPEDASVTKFKIVTTTPTAQADLYYNSGGGDVLVTNNQIITGYVAANLSIRYKVAGVIQVSFTYASIDSAGVEDTTPATFTINSPSTLPITGLELKGMRNGADVKLDWTTLPGARTRQFEVEKSLDGSAFRVIGTVKASGQSSITQEYKYIDNGVTSGMAYYRIRLYDVDGKVTLSNIALIKLNGISGGIRVFPNPANQFMYVQLSEKGRYKIELLNAASQVVHSGNFTLSQPGQLYTLQRGSLPNGAYLLRVVNELTQQISTLNILIKE